MKAYEGNKPYIFISYAHKDSDTVLPILEALSEAGYRIWYDAGIGKGTHWGDYIANHIDNCAVFIPFISKAFCESKYCQREMFRASEKDVDALPIYLENVNLSEVSSGNDMWIGPLQKMFLYDMSRDTFIRELLSVQLLFPCMDQNQTRQDGSSVNRPQPQTFLFCPECGASVVPNARFCVSCEKALSTVPTTVSPPVKPKPTPQPIPSPLTDFEIEDGVLKNYIGNAEQVVIPNSVTSIGDGAFSGCDSLAEIVIPNSVTSIGNGAFYYCGSLAEIVIPNSVTSIGDSAFSGCKSLVDIVIPNSVTSIGEWVFYDCKSLVDIVIPNSVTSIGNWAFWGCGSLVEIVIPNSVTSIGDYAFAWCNSLTIYCEAKYEPDGDWNPDNRPVVWGYKG